MWDFTAVLIMDNDLLFLDFSTMIETIVNTAKIGETISTVRKLSKIRNSVMNWMKKLNEKATTLNHRVEILFFCLIRLIKILKITIGRVIKRATC
jgi:hypothetical protein